MSVPRRRVAEGSTALRPSAAADAYGFAIGGLHRVQAAVIAANAASLGVVRRAGMRHEGAARNYLMIAGAWEDHEIFALTVEDSPAMRLPSLT